jgi:hypothetical protein
MNCSVHNGGRATDQAIILDGVGKASRPHGPKVGDGVALKVLWLHLLPFLRDLPTGIAKSKLELERRHAAGYRYRDKITQVLWP